MARSMVSAVSASESLSRRDPTPTKRRQVALLDASVRFSRLALGKKRPEPTCRLAARGRPPVAYKSPRFPRASTTNWEFTVTAQVHDPVPAQTLILELPEGIELVEGREIQPVPEAPATAGAPLLSFVEWRCSVRELGCHRLRLRSSTGVTQTKILTVSR